MPTVRHNYRFASRCHTGKSYVKGVLKRSFQCRSRQINTMEEKRHFGPHFVIRDYTHRWWRKRVYSSRKIDAARRRCYDDISKSPPVYLRKTTLKCRGKTNRESDHTISSNRSQAVRVPPAENDLNGQLPSHEGGIHVLMKKRKKEPNSGGVRDDSNFFLNK